MTIIEKLLPLYRTIETVLTRYISPLFDLAVRVWIGLVFFRSGLEKAKDWETTVFLFQEEYKLPLLSPEVAAGLGMATELTMPLLLFAGLAARLAAVPLMALTCVIQFVLGATNEAYNHTEHFYWLFLLGFIFVRGPGRLSVDHLIAQRFAHKA